jgi:hypothetical protein
VNEVRISCSTGQFAHVSSSCNKNRPKNTGEELTTKHVPADTDGGPAISIIILSKIVMYRSILFLTNRCTLVRWCVE